jgi:hypothetical protein
MKIYRTPPAQRTQAARRADRDAAAAGPGRRAVLALPMPVHGLTALEEGTGTGSYPGGGQERPSPHWAWLAAPQTQGRIKPALQMSPAWSSSLLLAPPRTSAKQIIQRAEARALRDFNDAFRTNHLRDASKFITDDDMIDEALNLFAKRAKGSTSRNTLVFMTSYQQEVFKQQEHNAADDGFESKTQFPIVDVTLSGVANLYSAAKFKYGVKWNEGKWIVTHMVGVSSGTLTKTVEPKAKQHIVF